MPTSTGGSNPLDRRTFLKWMAAVLGGTTFIPSGFCQDFFRDESEANISDPPSANTAAPHKKLIFIAIDGLHPKYLELDAEGYPGGKKGNWLMPNIRKFMERSLWYPDAKCYLPAATDMNHLNALAGTNSAMTGIVGVWAQPTSWKKNGKPVISHSHLSFAKDDRGRPVDTLFHAWKRRWPDSKTMMISGKEWVAEMFRQPKSFAGVDIIVTGSAYPGYLAPPVKESFVDPVTDSDARCDPESSRVGFLDSENLTLKNFAKHFSPSSVMTRLYTGQRSLLTLQMEHFANRFPHDKWIVDSTLEIFKREAPDMAYILLAQCDDACHCVGSAWNFSEFISSDHPIESPGGCIAKSDYQLVSSRNRLIYREGALDAVRDVDIQFGRLIKGFDKQGVLDEAAVVLLSDHSAENHMYSNDFMSTDVVGILKKEGVLKNSDMYAFSVSSYGVLYWRNRKNRIPRAKAILLSHKAFNSQSRQWECPWWVLDRDDMKQGVSGVSLPGELYHNYYIDVDKERSMIWPDLFILAKNGWQIPVYNGHVPNVGIKAPTWTPPFRVYNGGHGSVDTLPIVAAISLPGGKTGEQDRPLRIADLGVTAASLFGLELLSTTIGRDLRDDLINS